MSLNFRLTPDAKDDVLGIRQHTVKQWGVEQSNKYLQKLQETIHLLTESPDIGVRRADIGELVQSFPCQSHTIYYIQSDKNLVVFAVLHQSMVPASHLVDRSWRIS